MLNLVHSQAVVVEYSLFRLEIEQMDQSHRERRLFALAEIDSAPLGTALRPVEIDQAAGIVRVVETGCCNLVVETAVVVDTVVVVETVGVVGTVAAVDIVAVVDIAAVVETVAVGRRGNMEEAQKQDFHPDMAVVVRTAVGYIPVEVASPDYRLRPG